MIRVGQLIWVKSNAESCGKNGVKSAKVRGGRTANYQVPSDGRN